MERAGGPSTPSLTEVALRTMLVQHPDALLAAVDDGGLFVAMPATVPATGHPIAAARSALDLVQPADRMAVIHAWERVRHEGAARAAVALAGSDRPNAFMHFFDVRAEHGVFVVLTVVNEAVGGDLALVAAIAPPAPRLARTTKNEIALIIGAEPSVTAMLGWGVEELLGRRSLDFVHPDDQDRAINVWMECLSQPGYTCRARVRHRHRDGRWIWLEIANHNRLDEPGAGFVDCEMFDISEEMEAHEAVRASEQLLRRLAGALPVGVAQFDTDRRIVYANERLYEILGAPVGTDAATLLTSVTDRDAMTAALAALYAGEDVDTEIQIDRIDGGGSRRCTLSMRALTSGDGEVIGGVCSLADVTDAARMRTELERRATYDALTGCMNRATVMTALSGMLTSTQEDAGGCAGDGIAVVFIDLDDFKSVNDRFGHGVGDALLAAVAARLRDVVRGADVVGRLGGDEFLVVCPNVAGRRAAQALGERVVTAVVPAVTIGAVELRPRASVGVAWAAQGAGIDAEALIAEADAAMYAAKHAGHGRAVVTAAS